MGQRDIMNKGRAVNLLLVEDDDLDARDIERSLQKAKVGNPLYRARDGVEALEMVRNGDVPHPRNFLVDINMPRMSGIEFVKKLREMPEFSTAIVFILTTSKLEEDIVAAYDLNVAGYIIKDNAGENYTQLIDMLDCYWKIVEMPD